MTMVGVAPIDLFRQYSHGSSFTLTLKNKFPPISKFKKYNSTSLSIFSYLSKLDF